MCEFLQNKILFKIQIENAFENELKNKKKILLFPPPLSLLACSAQSPLLTLGLAQPATPTPSLSLSRRQVGPTGQHHLLQPPPPLSVPKPPAPAPTISPSPPRLGSRWRAPARPSRLPSPISFCLASAPLESALKNRRKSAAGDLLAKSVESSHLRLQSSRW
jgi:hypothetical protein